MSNNNTDKSTSEQILAHDDDSLFEKTTMDAQRIREEIEYYEQLHGFDSEELLRLSAEGNAPDSFAIQDWLSLLKLRNAQ
ncbi:MAG: hypothetical protein AAFV93_04005 [Chloroflexota bacterium]